MILRNCDMKTLFERCRDKKIVCYGIGHDFDMILKNYARYPWNEKVEYLVDNSPAKWETTYQIGSRQHKIMSLEQLLQEDVSKLVIFISCSYFAEIVEQLNTIEKLNNVECYIYYFMFALSEHSDICIKRRKECLIPPAIHYCWFGGNELPDLYKRCIESWHKYCPDYEIKEWNESNCDINENLFVKQAYEKGKFGFVPDYFRLKIIYEHGGIYLDTDVEVIKNLDNLRYNEAFCGMQIPGEANLGLGFGAVKGHPAIAKMLERYQKMQFIKPDGTCDETASPVLQTIDLRDMGMQYCNQLQEVCGMTIYPTEVLSPKNLVTREINITENTYAIHHFDGSWVSGERFLKNQKRLENVRKIQKLMQQDNI